MRAVVAAGWLALGCVYRVLTLNPHAERWLIVYLAFLLLCFTWRKWEKFDALDWLVTGFIVYAAESLLWSLDWRHGIESLTNLSVLGIGFILLRRVNLPDFHLPAALALFGATTMYWIAPGDNGSFGNPNFFCDFILILLPFTFSRYFPVGIYAMYTALQTSSNEPYLIIAMFLVWAYWEVFGRWALLSLLAVPVLVWLTWSNWTARLEIWINSFFAFLDAPLFGSGIGSFQAIYDMYRESHIAVLGQTLMNSPSVLAGAAHNEILQVLVELGLVGLVFAGVIAWFVVRNWPMAIVAALSMISFPLHNPATAGLIVCIAASLAPRSSPVFVRGLGMQPFSRYAPNGLTCWLRRRFTRMPRERYN